MMDGMARQSGTLNVPPETRDKFSKWCAAQKLNLKRGQVADRLLQWFMLQPDIVRTVVMNVVDKGMEAPYANALEELAHSLREKSGIPKRYLDVGTISPLSPPPGQQNDAGKPEKPPEQQPRQDRTKEQRGKSR